MKDPRRLSCPCIERLDVAARHFLIRRSIADRRTDYHNIAAHKRWRCDGEIACSHSKRNGFNEVYLSAVAEARHQIACARIDRYQVRIAGANEYSGSLAVSPIR